MTDPLVAELRKFAEKYEGGKVGSLLAQAAAQIEELKRSLAASEMARMADGGRRGKREAARKAWPDLWWPL